MERRAMDWIDQVTGTLCPRRPPRTLSDRTEQELERVFGPSPLFMSANPCPLKNLGVKRLLAGHQKIVICSSRFADFNVILATCCLDPRVCRFVARK
jgi:hypothetical protein